MLFRSLVTAAVSAHADPHGFYGRGGAPAYGAGFPPAVVTQPAPVVYGHHGHHSHPLAGLNEIRARQAEQIARIERGFHRGSITRWEFRRLMAEQQDISAMERTFVADGFLAPHERAELHRRLDIASRHIFFESHDAQRRWY